MDKKKLPIGYYLKEADQLLTSGINKIHAEAGLTRTDWQILNSINRQDGLERTVVLDLLAKFATMEIINGAIENLVRKNLIFENITLNLTDKGKEIYRSGLERQNSFREKAMRDISEQEYLQLIATLEKVIENLN
ncbi:MAG TPA: hypothetical protein VGB63_07000 [Pedobacter sp.]|jgi:DNA-binding MarR family transcriptional regulator